MGSYPSRNSRRRSSFGLQHKCFGTVDTYISISNACIIVSKMQICSNQNKLSNKLALHVYMLKVLALQK